MIRNGLFSVLQPQIYELVVTTKQAHGGIFTSKNKQNESQHFDPECAKTPL